MADAYLRRVHSYAFSRVGPDLADDVASETFLLAHRLVTKHPHLPQGEPLPWLLGIATNVIAQQRRSETRWLQRGSRCEDRLEARDAATDDEIVARLDASSIAPRAAEALARLRSGDRDALLLHAIAGLTYEQIAVALAILVGTVRSRINRARKRVKARIGSGS